MLALESKVFGPGCCDGRLINWDNGSVRVSHETTIDSHGGSVSIDSAIDTLGEEVVSTSGSNSGGVYGDNSAIGVSDKASKGSRGSSVGNRGSRVGNSTGKNWGLSCIDNSLSGEVLSTGSSNSWLINRDNSTVGVSNKLSVIVEGSSVSIVGSISSRGSSKVKSRGSRVGSHRCSRVGSHRCSSICRNRGSYYWGLSGKESSLGIEVFSTGSCNSWLINRDNSTVGVSNELGVEVEGARVAVGGGISSRGISSRDSSIAEGAGNSDRGCSIKSSFGSEMLGPGSSYGWLINGSDGSVWVTNKTEEALGRADRKRNSKNQKLHDKTC